jgi:sarcosine oxidase subunit delta
MLLIPCPHCGDRPEIEFAYGGEAHRVRAADPRAVDDASWTEYLYIRRNARGDFEERWRHAHGCGRFFNLRRNTYTDMIDRGAAR